MPKYFYVVHLKATILDPINQPMENLNTNLFSKWHGIFGGIHVN